MFSAEMQFNIVDNFSLLVRTCFRIINVNGSQHHRDDNSPTPGGERLPTVMAPHTAWLVGRKTWKNMGKHNRSCYTFIGFIMDMNLC